MTTGNETIRVEEVEGVRTITLHRPDVLNAFNVPLLEALGAALQDAARDDVVRCLVLTGAGRAFCSGQDLGELTASYAEGAPIDLEARLHELYHPVIVAIRTMEKPVVAAVNGVAAGAGCSLALACDLRVAAESASFIQAFVHVGLVPDCASTFMLPRLVGMARALELAWTGRRVAAGEALETGLVNQVVADAALGDAAGKLARQLAEQPVTALGLIKRAMNAAWTSDLETQLGREAQLQALAARTEDHREGVQAFREKRRPVFRR